MKELSPGGNAKIPTSEFSIEISLPNGAEIDVTALQLYAGGKVRGDGDMCFYGQKAISGGAVRLDTSNPTRVVLRVNPAMLQVDIEKIVITATIDGKKTFGDLGAVVVHAPGLSLPVPGEGRTEKALILAEIYRRNGEWKIRNVGQGFNGGLAALATHFGVEISDSKPAPEPVSAPKPSTLNLSKVSLTKSSPSISLQKNDGRFGKIRVNLNWNQRPAKSGFLGIRSSGIDLDLGALIEDRHGNITAVQALGGGMGDYGYFPYAKLLGDDRTGAVSDGEWLEINGDMWSEINRILIFAFIYSGVPNWQETDGVVKLFIPGQPEIDVRMNEFENTQSMCAVALLENSRGQVKVSREVKFFRGHRFMDDHYGWGLRWVAGSK